MAKQKLLVLMDASDRSLNTLDYIRLVPPFMEMRINLFHVFTGVPDEFWDLGDHPLFNPEARELKDWEARKKYEVAVFMEKARETLMAAGFSGSDIDINIQPRNKGVARDILEEAGKGYAAVIMRRRGAAVLEGITVGSVAQKLISTLTFLPVIVAGRHPPGKKILIGVDGSKHSIRAVDYVGNIYGGRGYDVCLFHVIRGIGSFVPDMPDYMVLPEYVESARLKMTKLFKTLRGKLISAGFKPEHITEKITVLSGAIPSPRAGVMTYVGDTVMPARTGVYSRAGAIVSEAEEEGYGTIVVGRKGLSAVKEFFMGRVSSKVIHGGRKFTVWVI
jgi:nucleotide-binding universal stress UspA family protein